ncbi:MAG: GerMN domain-containing protein [Bacillota bacterium]
MWMRYRWWIGVLVILLAGAMLKALAVPAGRADLGPEAQTGRLGFPTGGEVVTLFFPEAESGALITVQRAVRKASPEVALAELLAGPDPKQPLRPVVPDGVKVTGSRIEDGRVILQVEGGDLPDASKRAIALSLGVHHVEVGDKALHVVDGPRLYYMHRGMPRPLILAGAKVQPKHAVEALLSRKAPDGVAWIPPGVTLDAFAVKKSTAYVRLRFSPELQTLVESGAWNFAPYYMGLVYTLTDYPEIEQVRFEFTGLSQVALKQCRTPLSVPLRRPVPEPARSQEGR